MAWFDYRGPKDHDDGMAWLLFGLQTGIETTTHYAGLEIHVVRAIYGSTVVTAVVIGAEVLAGILVNNMLFVDENYLQLFGNIYFVRLPHAGFQDRFKSVRRLRRVP